MKSLIISPHLDDEVLGCYSVLNNNSFVLYCGCDESHIKFDWVKERPEYNIRLSEFHDVQTKHKFEYHILDNKVNEYQIIDLIPQFEKYINLVKPDEVYIPVPSYNQDHRIIYEAALTALRPHDLNFFVKKVFIYEQLQDLWNHNYHFFNPIHFKPIDIEDKISTYMLYKTQVRNFRSPDMLRTLAHLRGIQSNIEYAEGFEIIRYIE